MWVSIWIWDGEKGRAGGEGMGIRTGHARTSKTDMMRL